MTLFEILSFFITPLMGIVEPYVQQLTQWLASSNLHRKIVKFIIGLLVLVLLIRVSLVAYLSFYWIYIPQRGHVGQVYLQYAKPTVPGVIGEGPFAQVDFTSGGRYGQFLRAEQAYDISINLHVPASERNVEIGNFMVEVTLSREDGREITTASRPAILTYQSMPLKLMRTAWKAVPLVLEWSKEDQIIKVPLLDNFVEDSRNPVAKARIQISTPALQVYKSSIHIDAHFHGLRYFMYYYKVSTALVFMTVFIFWEIVFSVLTWQLLASWFGTDAEALAISHQIQPHAGVQGGQSGPAGQKRQQQQQSLHAPTVYSSNTTSASRKKTPSTASSHRQPQLLEQEYGSDSDAEFEEEEQILLGDSHSRGRKGDDLIFEHDEMDDEMDDDQDQDLRHLESQSRRPTYRDEAVVPENPSTSSQSRHGAGVTSSRSRSSQQQQQQRATTTTTSTTSQQQRGGEAFLPADDGFSVAGSNSTSGTRRTGVSGMDASMTSSNNTYPPPPPPSVFSDLTSELAMPNVGGDNSRRTAVESEYTEEDDEYLEDDAGADDDGDDEEDDDGDMSFGEEDFSEAGHLSRSGAGSGSVRSRHAAEGRRREDVAAASSGRSTGRSGA